ncbi:MAG: hypothetical protein J5621_00830 [Paludibacteraceae bacterium]|nr:hypothetical protein [Paludibacteraceae bacterium]
MKEYLAQPGQTVVALQRQFNTLRLNAGKPRVGAATFYGWCRGDYVPTKDWDMSALSELTGIAKNKLFV